MKKFFTTILVAVAVVLTAMGATVKVGYETNGDIQAMGYGESRNL